MGVPTVRAEKDGGDPAAVAFDAVRAGVRDRRDVVLVDTAGRLQNKAGLMDELAKITRVITREAPLTEVLLVLDATTGQNGLNQARVFSEVAGVTGIVLTKLDGTAKGGIVVAVQRELGVPVKLVGLGEGPDDLAPFDPEAFVDGLLQS
ncbi:signal recognition particle receptor FtsY [mine drainage metagenome]|uniref:Signal recognition particle receptor FtsY n=1 Tax=mine drainage metagenome TaxID=410659 RepID=A0A1J5QPM9_9ZZZZ